MNLTFGRKLMLVIVLVLALAQLASGLAVWLATNRYASVRVAANLEVAAGVLVDLLQARSTELESRLSLVANDFGFRQAVASADLQTIESALANHGDRLGAGLVMYADADGNLVASSHHDVRSSRQAFPLPELVDASAERSQRIALFASGNQVYLLAVVPVRAPLVIGWLSMGILLEDRFTAHLRSVTGQHVAFWTSPGGKVSLSTLEPALEQSLEQTLGSLGEAQSGPVQALLKDEPYLVLQPVFESPRLSGVNISLLASLVAAREVFGPLKMQLLMISMVALLLSLLLALTLGRAFTRPISALVAAAHRIQSGSYEQAVPVPRDRELGGLAGALNQMQEAISARESEISHQARHDSLTGLANRAVAYDRLETATRRARRRNQSVAVIMVDLNRFKEINDALGHGAGDLVLQEVARRLQQAVRTSDTVCRLGGDEFLVLLEEGAEESLLGVARNLVGKLNGDAEIAEFRLRIGASAGIAFFPGHGESPEDLLRRADIAMYRAKAQGQNLLMYEPGQDEHHLRQVRLVSDLPVGLQSGQFSIRLQPKADAKSMRVYAAEALIRWEHPEFGMVSPEEFISLAEHSGTIRQLTRWVIKQVMQQQAAWRRRGLELNVSINLSAMDLMDLNFPELLLSYGRLYEVPAECLTLEITESTIMTDAAIAESVLHRLRQDGYSISIDDFGTGYSSLSQLKRMPVSELKVDKSFVLNMEHSADDAVIVRSTVSMARSLGINVVVEGVENLAVLEMLQAWGVNSIQGYYLARPMVVDEFEAWLAERESGGLAARS